MKIAQIIPGSGGTFYCQNCVRDLGLVRALRRGGHDVVLVPMYLPLELNDPEAASGSPLFYGAVQTYLKEAMPWFRRLPRWFWRLCDARAVLGLAARQSGSTSAPGLAELTLSMLAGEVGGQAEELERLVAWLKSEVRPDVVCLSNALLLGMAGRIKAETGAAIVCVLQDEDVWVEAMPPAAQARIWSLMAEKGRGIDHFIAVSHYYAAAMAARLDLPAARISVVYPGTDFSFSRPATPDPAAPTIGYLSRLAESLGLEILVDAFVLLKRRGRIPGLRLRIAGGHTPSDQAFLRRQQQKLRAAGCQADVVVVDRFDRESRAQFLQTLNVLSVPVPRGEAFGAYVIEALGCGVPVVQPRVGAFPELVEATGGGVVYEPNDSKTLADTLESLLLDPVRAQALGAAGRSQALEYFNPEKNAEATLAVYRKIAGGPAGTPL